MYYCVIAGLAVFSAAIILVCTIRSSQISREEENENREKYKRKKLSDYRESWEND